MINNIKFILKRNRGWGFQEANLNYNTNMSLLVLPCSWVDPSWINNPYSITFNQFFKPTNKIWNFDTFFPGVFGYHWHNRWENDIAKTSICKQLDNIIIKELKIVGIYFTIKQEKLIRSGNVATVVKKLRKH